MDSHKDTLAVSGVDAAGRQQQAQVVPNTRQGHCRLLGWLPSRMRRIAAQRGLVLLVGMLGHPGWSWTVVADDGRTHYRAPSRGSRFVAQPEG